MTWRVGVWCAVSSQQQATEDKVSLEDQENAGRRFAESVGGEVVAVYTVPGHSRDLIFYQEAEQHMDAYRQLRQDVQAGQLDVLFCLDVDRLGRDPALGQQVISLVEKSGGEVYMQSAPHQVGQKTAAHRYISAIQAVRAGEDQQLRKHRHASGMRGRVRRGFIANTPPLGYAARRNGAGEVIGYEFTPDIAAVDMMTSLFLQGHSYSEIRRRLDASPHRPRSGGSWGYDTIRHILSNDVYAGFPHWGDVRPDKPSDKYPARWSPELYGRIVQERNRRQSRSWFRRGSTPFRNVAYCARCGSGMGRNKVGNNYYLRCMRHAMKSTQGQSCHPNIVAEWRVVDAIAAWLEENTTPEVIDETLERWAPDDGAGADAELERKRAEIETLIKQRDRLALAYAQGAMDVEQYRRTDDRLLAQLDAAQKRADELGRVVKSLPDMDERRMILESLAEGFRLIMAVLEPAEVSQALQAAGLVVFCEDGQPVVGLW